MLDGLKRPNREHGATPQGPLPKSLLLARWSLRQKRFFEMIFGARCSLLLYFYHN
jgi:hypothetical protein